MGRTSSITMVAVATGRRVVTARARRPACKASPVLSSAVQVGNRLYLSGMLGVTDAARGNVAAQTNETLGRMGRTLEAAGFSWKNVVEAVVYLPDARDFAAMNEAYRAALPEPFPARTTVTGPGGARRLVEIMMTAGRRARILPMPSFDVTSRLTSRKWTTRSTRRMRSCALRLRLEGRVRDHAGATLTLTADDEFRMQARGRW